MSLVKITQFFGIDVKPFAVELAKVTLMLAKKLALDEEYQALHTAQMNLPLEMDKALPLDNLDENIRCDDALFCSWEEADAIIGNPPYQSKNKIQKEYGADYIQKVRNHIPSVPGMADYCVYWFYRTHEELRLNGRAGLVGTNTIRQNYSREGGLDHIVKNNGTITEAISSQVWSGDAVVNVSIVNWIKGEQLGKKKLFTQTGDSLDSPWEIAELDTINSSLSANLDVTSAKKILANSSSGICYQGQTHGHKGFLLTPDAANAMKRQQDNNQEVIFPYLIGEELLSNIPPSPERYVIDFHPRNILDAGKYSAPFQHVKNEVLATRQAMAKEEMQRNKESRRKNPKAKVNRHHQNFLSKWWLLSYARASLIEKISNMSRYVVCVRLTKRPIFEFIDSSIHPNDALQVFAVEDDYSFGILQSVIHWEWFVERCSTLKRDFRYTSNTVFDSFAFPQSPTLAQIKSVAKSAVQLRQLRNSTMSSNQMSLRDLYRTLELSGKNPLKSAHIELDKAVRNAYGMGKNEEPLSFLLNLNRCVSEREANQEPVLAPGLPPTIKNASEFISSDCVK